MIHWNARHLPRRTCPYCNQGTPHSQIQYSIVRARLFAFCWFVKVRPKLVFKKGDLDLDNCLTALSRVEGPILGRWSFAKIDSLLSYIFFALYLERRPPIRSPLARFMLHKTQKNQSSLTIRLFLGSGPDRVLSHVERREISFILRCVLASLYKINRVCPKGRRKEGPSEGRFVLFS